MTQTLPWVKWHTRLLSAPKWRKVPMDERGVFAHLVLLGGMSSKRGFIEGSDEDLADLLGCGTGLVTRAVERFIAKPFESLKRYKGGLLIVNWETYQAPANYDPAARYGRESAFALPKAVRKQGAFGTPNGGANVEKKRTEENRTETSQERDALLALRRIEGYPLDPERDPLIVADLIHDYPTLNVADQIKALAIWLLDHPLNAKSNPRTRLKNWMKKALEFQERDRLKGPAGPLHVEPIEVQRARLLGVA